MTTTIYIAAALLIGADGRTLLVRKRGTRAFMQPGGKIEADERPVDAMTRELHEELGITVDPLQAVYLGQFSAPAANEPGFEVRCELFRVQISEDVHPAAEIEEVIWVDQQNHSTLNLAPLTRDHILPVYYQTAEQL